jgi:predicted O-methyltransferase YrrM
MIIAYLKYLLKRGNAHSIHSPFVFELYNEAIDNPYLSNLAEEPIIEKRRLALKNNPTSIEITDFGAGSRKAKGNNRQISEIARNAEKSKKVGHFLAKLIARFDSKVVFDLGTSFGITTAYEAAVLKGKNATHYSFEGCDKIAAIAQETLNEISAETQLKIGPLEKTLAKAIETVKKIDFVYFDANHQYEPTVAYFTQCLEKAHDNTVFVFDDIHWSPGMEQAWAYIKAHPKAIVTIDLFELGIVFFRKGQVKEHFILKF